MKIKIKALAKKTGGFLNFNFNLRSPDKQNAKTVKSKIVTPPLLERIGILIN